MDNLTHSLAGLILGEAAIAWRERSGLPLEPRQRAAALTTAVLASNLPDLDILYIGITGGKLGYLLHHRGHTHTVAAVLPLALFCLALVVIGFRLPRPWQRRSEPARAGALGWLGLLAASGGLLHLLMDFGNNYGVHPFWPVYDGWFHADAIFIIEPWLIIVLTGMAGGVSRSRGLRAALLLGLAALLALVWGVAQASVWLALALTVVAVPWVLGLWRASFRVRWRLGGGALVACGLLLLGTRHIARANAREALDREALDREGGATLRLVDLISTPAPGNPLCWSLLTVQRSERAYVVRQAVASGWPWLSSAASCRIVNAGQTAPVVPSSLGAAPSRELVWGPEFRAPLTQLDELQREDCNASAFLRFARAPFWVQQGERATLIGDLRFDRSHAVEFAELPLPPDAPCPRFEPPWRPPLDLPE